MTKPMKDVENSVQAAIPGLGLPPISEKSEQDNPFGDLFEDDDEGSTIHGSGGADLTSRDLKQAAQVLDRWINKAGRKDYEPLIPLAVKQFGEAKARNIMGVVRRAWDRVRDATPQLELEPSVAFNDAMEPAPQLGEQEVPQVKKQKLDRNDTMTDEQKFFFDLRGWLALPAVLTADEVAEMKEEVYAGANKSYEGVLQNLLDHPAVVGILTEILSEEPFVKDDSYSFRCEGSFITVRQPGWSTKERGDDGLPHVVRPPQQANAMRYQVAGKKIFSGLTRVVWELEEVKAGQGATSFLSGSHKAHFNYGGPNPYAPNIGGSPWEDSMREAMDDYSCPAGSVVIFTESLIHAANDWTNQDNPRCAVFNCYNSIWAQWHRLNLSHEIIETMSQRRRSLFRGTWAIGGGPDGNREYSLENRTV